MKPFVSWALIPARCVSLNNFINLNLTNTHENHQHFLSQPPPLDLRRPRLRITHQRLVGIDQRRCKKFTCDH